MNGVHDMGGMHGLGPVIPEPEGEVFHEAWEGRVHALTLASPTRGNIDAGRHRLELLPAADYLRMSYYEKWLTRLEMLLVENGFVTADELASATADPTAPKATPVRPANTVEAALTAPYSYIRQAGAPAFAVGDRVRAKTRGTSTASASRRGTCGGRTRGPATASASTCGSLTLSAPDVLALPRLPRDADGPIFAEPWQAQAFALTLKLHETGAFTWTQWAQALSLELARDPSDDGSRYYEHWVAALERLTTSRNLAGSDELETRKKAWKDAYLRTPHGHPVEL